MQEIRSGRVFKYWERALISAPIVALAVMAISWLVYGIDLPYLDDWDALSSGQIGSLELSYLFKPLNDTMFPVGRLLDAISVHFLNYNSIAYQFISMTVCLGSMLALQWTLLRSAIKDRAVVVGAFALTIFMMQPGSYWGLQNLAYHQILPLLFLMAILVVATRPAVRPAVSMIVCFALGILAGFSYISGAFGTATAAIVFAVFCFRYRQFVPPLIGLALSTLVTLPMQLWVVIGVNHGQIHTRSEWVLPDTIHFWMYFFGKLARAFSLQSVSARLSIVVVLAAVLFLFFITAKALLSLASSKDRAVEDVNRDIIMTTLTAVVFVYLLSVTASRAGLIGPDFRSSTYGEMFTYAFARFHFFWVTVLIPWIFAYACRFLPTNVQRPAALAAGTFCLWLAINLGVASNPSEFKRISDDRSESAIACLQGKLLNSQPLSCPGVLPWALTNFEFGSEHGLSYSRYFPPVLQDTAVKVRALTEKLAPTPVNVISPKFDLVNAIEASRSGEEVTINAETDPNLIVTGDKEKMASCHHMIVRADVTPTVADAAQLFFIPQGFDAYTEAHSKAKRLTAGIVNELKFEVFSQGGFEPSFRLDPVSQQQVFRISGFSYYCDY